jgi:hypothetical protein
LSLPETHKKEKTKKMNKYILPSTAAFLILVMAVSSYTPAMAVARITLTPTLEVVTIPEDDQIRNTGVMLLGITPPAEAGFLATDFLSQHKISITINGVPLVYSSAVVIACNVAEKDKIINPPWVTTGKSPTNLRQFQREMVETSLVDVAQFFVCKFRPKVDGYGVPWTIGVLDVYFTGPAPDAAFIADHILTVHVMYTVGRQVFYGTEIQDICLLGWSMTEPAVTQTLLGNENFYHIADPLGNWASCEQLAVYQLYLLAHPAV